MKGEFPNCVRELREERRMTQAELAKKAGVAIRTVGNTENGNWCRMNTKRKLLAALDIPFSEKDSVFQKKRLR